VRLKKIFLKKPEEFSNNFQNFSGHKHFEGKNWQANYEEFDRMRQLFSRRLACNSGKMQWICGFLRIFCEKLKNFNHI
jgi:hypothetical protein